MHSTVKSFILATILAFATLFSASFFWDKPIVATSILVCLSFFMLLIEWKKRNILLFLFTFVSGSIAEIIAIYFGAWSYAHPFIAGIPPWLPFVWGNSSLYIVRVKALIDRFF